MDPPKEAENYKWVKEPRGAAVSPVVEVKTPVPPNHGKGETSRVSSHSRSPA